MERFSDCEVVRRVKGSQFVLFTSGKGNYFIEDMKGEGFGICLAMYDSWWLPWWSRRNMAIQMYETFIKERGKWEGILASRKERRKKRKEG